VENIELGADGYFYLFPSLTIDKDHNAAITFSRSADTEYIGAYYSTKYANDITITPSQPIAVGKGNYVVSYGTGINRWGDYFGIYLDPENDYDVWMISEYAAATNIWGTYVGHIRMAPYPGAHAFLNPKSINFGDVEIQTTSSFASVILANYGENDLVISNIPSSFEDFNLETNLSFPITLFSYDSLTIEFSYSPNTLGNTSVLYPITTNDPDFNGITLSGHCYKIVQAIEKTIYASSGSQNNGNIVTINKVNGQGIVIGQSLFSEVKGLAINPLNGIIYGLVAASGTSEIIRVNSESGDAYKLFNINIPSVADVAFDTSGTFYGISVNGELYTIDLLDGSVDLVVDAIGSYSGITFNPQTNELWATSRAFTLPNKDAVFKVNLTTGDTTIIGHTGLNKITNDLIFDENLNLYGVIGSATDINDFIRINTSTGVGTILGSTGMKNILGLAYTETIPTNVEYENGKDIPTDYALFQNYPNPFNPKTNIQYAISSRQFVSLKVYDVLGNEIETLVNEEKPAGKYEITFDACKLTSGIYFYQLKSKSFIETKKMILLK
jgi:hypothetical protein